MFHIVLNTDENYMKYAAVLITSIIKNTDTTKRFTDFLAINKHLGNNSLDTINAINNTMESSITPPPPIKDNSIIENIENIENIEKEKEKDEDEGYCFHILTDSILETTQQKFQQLFQELTQIYPCSFIIHKVNNKEFQDFNAWGFETTKNFATYYRICLTRFLPKDLQTCLYIDVDMLVNADIRELFAIDLGDKIAGVVYESIAYSQDIIIESKSPAHQNITLSHNTYFNAGLLLLNLTQFREQDIESKCLDILHHYKTTYNDQDALNIAFGNKTLELDSSWNAFIHFIIGSNKKTKQPFQIFKIYHYASATKPWINSRLRQRNKLLQDYQKPWWDMAAQTPIFQTELLKLQENLKNSELQDCLDEISILFSSLQTQINTLQRRIRFIRYPHKVLFEKIKKLF